MRKNKTCKCQNLSYPWKYDLLRCGYCEGLITDKDFIRGWYKDNLIKLPDDYFDRLDELVQSEFKEIKTKNRPGFQSVPNFKMNSSGGTAVNRN